MHAKEWGNSGCFYSRLFDLLLFDNKKRYFLWSFCLCTYLLVHGWCHGYCWSANSSNYKGESWSLLVSVWVKTVAHLFIYVCLYYMNFCDLIGFIHVLIFVDYGTLEGAFLIFSYICGNFQFFKMLLTEKPLNCNYFALNRFGIPGQLDRHHEQRFLFRHC